MVDGFDETMKAITAFVGGGTEGFLAPVMELIVSTLLFTAQTVQQSMQVMVNNTPAYANSMSFFDVGLVFAVFAAREFLAKHDLVDGKTG